LLPWHHDTRCRFKGRVHHVDYDLVLETGSDRFTPRRAADAGGERDGGKREFTVFYNRVKGQMESALIEQGWPRLTLARPSMLLGERGTPRLNERLLAPLFSLLPGNWKSIAALDVAKAMLRTAKNPASPGDDSVVASAQRNGPAVNLPGHGADY
jgi:hypothetical protein